MNDECKKQKRYNQNEKLTWLSQEVAMRKLALGLKERLETESEGGEVTSWDLLGLVFVAPKLDIVLHFLINAEKERGQGLN